MDDERDGRIRSTQPDSGRHKRLASALRANLLRRKKQAQERSREGEPRGREADAKAGKPSDPDPSHDSAEIIPDKNS